MADLKISQLSSATALAGTEVVPVVQGGSTKKATVDQILAPASGKGINFAAAGGDTLKMYDEGTFAPTVYGSTTVGTATYAIQDGRFTRIGNRFFFQVTLSWTGHTGTGDMRFGGFPTPSVNVTNSFAAATIGYFADIATGANTIPTIFIPPNESFFSLQKFTVGGSASSGVAVSAAGTIAFSGSYEV